MLLFLTLGKAQTQLQLDAIKRASDTSGLRSLQQFIDPIYQQNRLNAEQWALQNGLPIVQYYQGYGGYRLVNLIDSLFPEFIRTDNVIAAKTISTDQLKFGGRLGLVLLGNNYKIWMWDPFIPFVHQEMRGRINHYGKGGKSALNDHPTHVGGTMISRGAFDIASEGMATDANLLYENAADDAPEMALAAIDGAIISNHSYSLTIGWDWSGSNWYWHGIDAYSIVEDYRAGFYNTDAQNFDNVAYQAPYYLFVKTAGNNRHDYGPTPGNPYFVLRNGRWVQDTISRNPDGDYDCLPPRACAKNGLTVGAVDDVPNGYRQVSDVKMTPFSGWGPTDDGRIKPDLVANGVGVYSTVDSIGYASFSGTSMAAPGVTGSVILLQEHYSNTHQFDLMRSATVRALVLHTADEAGANPGPDYSFGWGLMNSAKAANAITLDQNEPRVIREQVLHLGAMDTLRFTYTGLGDPFIRVTVAWTDPPGESPMPALNTPQSMLINDLDVRLVRIADGQIFEPYILNPAQPALAASTGDNFRDNIEMIHLSNPQSGDYRIELRHKGNLFNNAPQAYSMVISGLANSPILSTGDVFQGYTERPFVSPNPGIGRVWLYFGEAEPASGTKLMLMNTEGRLVRTQVIRNEQNRCRLKTENLDNGIYFFRYQDRLGEYHAGKFMLQR